MNNIPVSSDALTYNTFICDTVEKRKQLIIILMKVALVSLFSNPIMTNITFILLKVLHMKNLYLLIQ